MENKKAGLLMRSSSEPLPLKEHVYIFCHLKQMRIPEGVCDKYRKPKCKRKYKCDMEAAK